MLYNKDYYCTQILTRLIKLLTLIEFLSALIFRINLNKLQVFRKICPNSIRYSCLKVSSFITNIQPNSHQFIAFI